MSVLLGGGLAIGLLVAIPQTHAGGLPGVVGVAGASVGLVTSLVALVLRRKAPRKLAWPAVALLVGVVGAASSGLLAFSARSPALSDEEVADPALVAWARGEAQAKARIGAELGLATTPAIALGLVGLWLAVGARRRGKEAAPPHNVAVESVPLAVTALVGAGLVSAGALAIPAAAVAADVVRTDHPRLPALRAIATDARSGALEKACGGLERALAPSFVPPALLEREIPDYREIAARCVTLRIDALPKGLPCGAQAGKLAASPLVKAAEADDRVKHACAGAL